MLSQSQRQLESICVRLSDYRPLLLITKIYTYSKKIKKDDKNYCKYFKPCFMMHVPSPLTLAYYKVHRLVVI